MAKSGRKSAVESAERELAAKFGELDVAQKAACRLIAELNAALSAGVIGDPVKSAESLSRLYSLLPPLQSETVEPLHLENFAGDELRLLGALAALGHLTPYNQSNRDQHGDAHAAVAAAVKGTSTFRFNLERQEWAAETFNMTGPLADGDCFTKR